MAMWSSQEIAVLQKGVQSTHLLGQDTNTSLFKSSLFPQVYICLRQLLMQLKLELFVMQFIKWNRKHPWSHFYGPSMGSSPVGGKLGLNSNPFFQLQVMLRTAEKGSHAWYLGEYRAVPYGCGWQLGTMIKVQTWVTVRFPSSHRLW